METGSIALGVFLFIVAELIKFAFNMVINLFQKDAQDAVKVTKKKKRRHHFWEMIAEELKQIAQEVGLPREVKLEKDFIVELVELNR